MARRMKFRVTLKMGLEEESEVEGREQSGPEWKEEIGKWGKWKERETKQKRE